MMRIEHDWKYETETGDWPAEETVYPETRRVMGPDYAHYDDEAIEDLLEELFEGADPGDVENFMRALQNFGKVAAPLAKKALPGMVSGAAQGGMVAGPWGALAGAVLGGAGSLLGGGGRKQVPVRAAPRQFLPGAPVAPPLMGGVLPAAGGSAAPAQLLALLSRPETMQALLSLLMSASGRGAVRVGPRRVPVGAFANAISELAAQVAEAVEPYDGEGLAPHLLEAHGSPRCDAANPAERALLLLNDLGEVALAELAEEDWEEPEDRSPDWDPAELLLVESFDPLEDYEAAIEGRDLYEE